MLLGIFQDSNDSQNIENCVAPQTLMTSWQGHKGNISFTTRNLLSLTSIDVSCELYTTQSVWRPNVSAQNLSEQDTAHRVDLGRCTNSQLHAQAYVMFTSLPTASYRMMSRISLNWHKFIHCPHNTCITQWSSALLLYVLLECWGAAPEDKIGGVLFYSTAKILYNFQSRRLCCEQDTNEITLKIPENGVNASVFMAFP